MPNFAGFTNNYLIAMMAGTWFPLHIEESDQASINLVHLPNREKLHMEEAQKVWIMVPPNLSHHVEKLLQLLVPEEEQCCSNFIAHRSILINPDILTRFGIDYYVGAQNEGEFTVVLPRAYHTGMIFIIGIALTFY